mmetsp:Transcript_4929/g.17377  ORF Transcript_4929/g.17377 Transcript_4929/m.17377 type:complete len:244 (+) Transcript_4929:1516-2247(+)
MPTATPKGAPCRPLELDVVMLEPRAFFDASSLVLEARPRRIRPPWRLDSFARKSLFRRFVPPRPFGANEKAPLMQKYAAPAAASSRRLRCAAVSRPPAPASVLRRAATPDAEDEDDENGAPVKVMTARPLCLDAPVAARHLCLDAYRFNASSPRFNASSPHTAAGGSYETSLSPSRSATPRGAHETPGGAYETSLSPPRSAQSPRSPQSRASGRSSDARPPERGELGVSLFAKFAYAAAAGAT